MILNRRWLHHQFIIWWWRHYILNFNLLWTHTWSPLANSPLPKFNKSFWIFLNAIFKIERNDHWNTNFYELNSDISKPPRIKVYNVILKLYRINFLWWHLNKHEVVLYCLRLLQLVALLCRVKMWLSKARFSLGLSY